MESRKRLEGWLVALGAGLGFASAAGCNVSPAPVYADAGPTGSGGQGSGGTAGSGGQGSGGTSAGGAGGSQKSDTSGGGSAGSGGILPSASWT
jgi:hypothetical protein